MGRKVSGKDNFADFIQGSWVILRILFVIAVIILLISAFIGTIAIGSRILPYAVTVYLIYRFSVFLGARQRKRKEKPSSGEKGNLNITKR